VIYLAKGGPKSGDAPYVVLSGIITGGLTGLFPLHSQANMKVRSARSLHDGNLTHTR